MKLSMNLYDALTAISVPPNKAKAVVNAWESDMEKFATKSDLLRTETHLQASITESSSDLRGTITALSSELRGMIKDQSVEIRALSSMIQEQGVELRASIKEQGAELRSAIAEQGAKFQISISEMDSQNKILRWQLGILLVCISIPVLKLAYDMLIKTSLY
ncbi:DUF503 family protein [Pseudomonas sp. FEN]|uniref:DUF503 family protein n=1 Tax=Pseudomonas sp. FEN TaxID=2767468 RepID=UPI001749C7B2|nr:DUF503 family protein [Pseudomonas sp. FEN]CAD5201235.1 hypothetical protein [Pseudomonas sp. FEN]